MLVGLFKCTSILVLRNDNTLVSFRTFELILTVELEEKVWILFQWKECFRIV